MKRILVIAGTDSSGGAGLTRDASTAQSLGLQPLPAVTAVTAQTDGRVVAIETMRPQLITRQIEAALACGPVHAIKIGMLGTAEIAEAVAKAIRDCPAPVVLDPVLKASSGGELSSGTLPENLLRQTDLITPNLPEAAMLTGQPQARSKAQIANQAKQILATGARAVLIKGGHGGGAMSVDHLFAPFGHRAYSAPRHHVGKRGTGCTLATAIACHLALGHDLGDACKSAKDYVQAWLQSAPIPGLLHHI